MSEEFEMSGLKRDDNEATSTELNVEQLSDGTSAGRTKLLIERDNQTLTRLGKVPVLKVSRPAASTYKWLLTLYL